MVYHFLVARMALYGLVVLHHVRRAARGVSLSLAASLFERK